MKGGLCGGSLGHVDWASDLHPLSDVRVQAISFNMIRFLKN